jgi:hypothetical protein
MGLWAGVFLIATGGKVGDGNICYTNGPSTSTLKNCCSVKAGVICKEHDND